MDTPRCSAVAEALGEPLAGTAATAQSWLCVEQPGPWGRDALSASHLDPGVARELARLAEGTGVRIILIRRPGSHPDRHRPVPRQVYLAHTAPGRTRLEHTTVNDPKELLDLDFGAAATGEPGVLGARSTTPLLMVCTNGRRDVCCALLGRPLATALTTSHGDAVWECTHIGGHRLSPTAVLLPTGYAYGRLTTEAARHLLDTDEVVTRDCRGRSTWQPPGQVADLAVREAAVLDNPDELTIAQPTESPGGWTVPVRSTTTGQTWQVTVTQHQIAAARPASCTATPTKATALQAESITETKPEEEATQTRAETKLKTRTEARAEPAIKATTNSTTPQNRNG